MCDYINILSELSRFIANLGICKTHIEKQMLNNAEIDRIKETIYSLLIKKIENFLRIFLNLISFLTNLLYINAFYS
jgi:hypothetical protein